MSSNLTVYYRMQNLLHIFVLLAGMLGLIGWVVAGTIGVCWALGTGVMVIMSASRYSYHLILYLTGARPMSGEHFQHKVLERLFYPGAKEIRLPLLRSQPLIEQRIQRLLNVRHEYRQPFTQEQHNSENPQMKSRYAPRHHFSGLWH